MPTSSRPVLCCLLALLFVLGCSDPENPAGPSNTPAVASVEVTPGLDTLTALDQGLELSALARDRDLQPLPDTEFEWSSSQPYVVAVDAATGRVIARAPGTAVITASSGDVAGVATLVVHQAIAKLTLSPSTWNPTALGQTQQLLALAADANNHPVVGAVLLYTTSDTTVSTSSATGLLNAVGNGDASITVAAGERTAVMNVVVKQSVATVTITPATWNPTALGIRQAFAAEAADANGHLVTDWQVQWGSSDSTIASIGADGLATATGPGAVQIRATTTGAAGLANVMVAQTLASIEVSPGTDTLRVAGDTARLIAQAFDPNGKAIAGVNFAWQSSHPAVATVSATGLVTAVAHGTATITATSGALHTAATLTVLKPPAQLTNLTLSPMVWTATSLGTRKQYNIWAYNEDGEPVEIPPEGFQTSNPSVATIDSRGLLTTLSQGTTTVTAIAAGMVATARVTVDRSGITQDGVVWSVYFAQEIPAVALLINDALHTPGAPRPWSPANVAKFDFAGPRVGILTDVFGGQGTLRVRDKIGEWTDLVIGSARDFQLEGNRIGALVGNGALWVKDGVNSGWSVIEPSGVSKFQLEGNRIGVLTTAKDFKVRDGIHGAWQTLADGNADDFELEGNRIAVHKSTGEFRVKDGIQGAWTVLATSGVATFQLEGDRIAVIHSDGRWRVKDGPSGEWTVLANSGVAKFQLEGSRIGVLHDDGEFRVKTGIHGAWTVMSGSGIRDFQLQGNRVSMLSDGDRLRIKDGSLSAAWSYDETHPGLTQWRPAVAVRASARYTTPALYDSLHASCHRTALIGVNDCVDQVYVPDLIENGIVTLGIPFYGYHCGKGRPVAAQDPERMVDGMDWVCRHHDKVESWYETYFNSGTWDLTGGCIVYYAIRNSRMTVNGQVAARESPLWWLAWGTMPNMYEAMVVFETLTSTCNESQMDLFIESTSLDL